ncbi:MAG: hypothetical protein HZC04_02175 [Candidatus Lloydbacteria bacterium]|nr:hypothetical protein [Candidatus Lloydbacteria bacterium]
MNEQMEILMSAGRGLEYPKEYGKINLWMDKRHTIDTEAASRQWDNVYRCVKFCIGDANIRLIQKQQAFPDMIFVRNAGLVIPDLGDYDSARAGERKKRIILSSFKNKERQGEREFYRRWFEQNGFEIIVLPMGVTFEGGGEAVWWKDTMFFGHGFRAPNDTAVHLEYALAKAEVPAKTISLKLVDERFYHLDTAFMPIRGDGKTTDDVLVYYPGAFDRDAQKIIEGLPIERLEVTEKDACAFGCNLLALGNNIIIAKGTENLPRHLKERKFIVCELNMDEIKKGGGSIYCMTLNLS